MTTLLNIGTMSSYDTEDDGRTPEVTADSLLLEVASVTDQLIAEYGSTLIDMEDDVSMEGSMGDSIVKIIKAIFNFIVKMLSAVINFILGIAEWIGKRLTGNKSKIKHFELAAKNLEDAWANTDSEKKSNKAVSRLDGLKVLTFSKKKYETLKAYTSVISAGLVKTVKDVNSIVSEVDAGREEIRETLETILKITRKIDKEEGSGIIFLDNKILAKKFLNDPKHKQLSTKYMKKEVILGVLRAHLDIQGAKRNSEVDCDIPGIGPSSKTSTKIFTMSLDSLEGVKTLSDTTAIRLAFFKDALSTLKKLQIKKIKGMKNVSDEFRKNVAENNKLISSLVTMYKDYAVSSGVISLNTVKHYDLYTKEANKIHSYLKPSS